MSNIVAVMGSPNSEGNTASAVDAVLNGAMGLSTNIIKYHNISKMAFIHGCRHCHHCVYTGDCDVEDDLSPTLKDIGKADVLVFATPVYFNMPTAQFKLVLDRMYSFLSVDRKTSSLAGKYAVIIVACSEYNERTKAMVENLTDAIKDFGIIVTDKLVYSDMNGTEVFKTNTNAIKRSYEVGKKFCKMSEIKVDEGINYLNAE